MAFSALDTRHGSTGRRYGALIAATTIGLAACGGASKTKTVTGADPPTAPLAAPTTTAAAPQASTTANATPTAADKRKRRNTAYHPSGGTDTTTTPNWVNTTGNSQTTTVPASPGSPKYVGPSPLRCLTFAGLDRARPTPEPEAWDANAPGTPATDSNAIVILSGPYKSATVAKRYAQSLLVVELAASGGRWVASAALRSHLGFQVNAAAACMASG